MGQKEFFLHEWEPEAMRRIVEGRKAYNEEQRRLEFAKMQEEIDVSRKKLEDGNKKLEDGKKELEDGKKELEEGKKELERLLDEKNKIEHIASEKAIEETINNTIKSMLVQGATYDFVSKVTNKKVEEIKEIEKSMKED